MSMVFIARRARPLMCSDPGSLWQICAWPEFAGRRSPSSRQQILRDLNVDVEASDTRRIEVITNGLPFWGGEQTTIDTTVVSALNGRGEMRHWQANHAL